MKKQNNTSTQVEQIMQDKNAPIVSEPPIQMSVMEILQEERQRKSHHVRSLPARMNDGIKGNGKGLSIE